MAPLIRQLIEEEGVGEERGGVGFAEIEFDSPTLGDVINRYMVRDHSKTSNGGRHGRQGS